MYTASAGNEGGGGGGGRRRESNSFPFSHRSLSGERQSGEERVRVCLLKRGRERERKGFVWQRIGKVEEEEVGS